MVFKGNVFRLACAAFAALSLAAFLPASAAAASPLPSGAVGSDISWPQCGGDYPTDPYWFGIIGVTGGHPFSANNCFGSEYAWAQATGRPQVYINLDYGLRASGPLDCLAEDTGCQAYNYGYQSAAWAYDYASQQSGGATQKQNVWWLDVETGNYWSDDSVQNAYVIQGALDLLQRKANTTAGVYSTSYMWGVLAGDFSPPGTPNWVAGAAGLDNAGMCQAAIWPGAEVWAVQYLNLYIDLDQNLAC